MAEAVAVAVAVAYEAQRQRQVEANKRKLDELQLHRLSAAVREAAAAAKPSPAKKWKARVPRDGAAAGVEPLRRSGRLADLPEKPVYYQVRVKKLLKYNARVPLDAAERSYAISKAEELVQDLGSSFPIFIQPMIQSHVTRGFWLGLPTYFCRKHLPKSDETITLVVDEEGDESDTLYLAKKAGLSTGWKEFAIEHKLHDGDCLVFQLIEQTKFKVYIIRATSYFESEH
ncbi:B3 domain-containing protein Os06g0194400 [Sorghum bicolor]|nr:B3 domain-containing protein Os06g0194400 [Sorghum bicolor]OQU82339.1 hypothetical protein SORBI_3006G217500 [Sorghum bicolor]OQU82340.1 hypothetical protein SORBI_3006G217500 [Sorghum bicolor]|eukprot:XP_002448540.1 B3 domain-containing protein Os06g0194400 [Sorghum bicolor]